MGPKTLSRLILACTLATLAFPIGVRADPIKLEAYATKASTGSNPQYATDGDPGTRWISTGAGTQWIQIDLGRTVSIQKIGLLPYQKQNGNSTHSIWVGASDPPTTLLATIQGFTYDNIWIERGCALNTLCGNVRYVRITTTQSPSQIAWRELAVYQGVEYFGYWGDGCVNSCLEGGFIPETASWGANIHMIEPADAPTGFNASSWQALLDQAAKNLNPGKVILQLMYLTFDFSPRADGKSLHVRDDFATVQLPAILNFIYLNRTHIAALYIMDEPYTNCWRYGVCYGSDWSGMVKMLTDVTTSIRIGLKGYGLTVPIAVIHSFRDIDAGPSNCPSTMFDWVGVDCYAPWGTMCSDNGQPLEYWLSSLRSQLRGGQRMIAVPSAYEGEPPYWFGTTEWSVVSAIGGWQNQVTQDPAYVAVLPFRYGALLGNPATGRGYAFTQVRERFRELAATLMWPKSTLVYPSSFDYSGFVLGQEPTRAFDGDAVNDMWNLGAPPTGAVTLHLGGSTHIAHVDLTLAQTPSGNTSHYVYGWSPVSQKWLLISSFVNRFTKDGDKLSWSGSADVSDLWIDAEPCTSGSCSNSWVAYKEMQISRVK